MKTMVAKIFPLREMRLLLQRTTYAAGKKRKYRIRIVSQRVSHVDS